MKKKYTKKEMIDQSISPDRNLIVTGEMMKQLLEHMPDDPEPEFFEGQYVFAKRPAGEYIMWYSKKLHEEYTDIRPVPDIGQWRPIPDDLMEMPSWLDPDEELRLRFGSEKEEYGHPLGYRWDMCIGTDDRITHVMRIPPCQS